MSHDALLRTIGETIRSSRVAAGLTQRVLGERAGIGARYVSEIERGTRDVPLSTLHAIVEDGLSLHLEILFRSENQATHLPQYIVQLATLIAELPAEPRTTVVAVVRGVISIVLASTPAEGQRGLRDRPIVHLTPSRADDRLVAVEAASGFRS